MSARPTFTAHPVRMRTMYCLTALAVLASCVASAPLAAQDGDAPSARPRVAMDSARAALL